MIKKSLSIGISIFFLILTLGYIEIKLPNTFGSLDARLHDFLFILRGSQKASDDIVIIDIDEKSLQQYHQWPWSRDVVAKLIDILSESGAGIIGLDIVFAEKDSSSPSNIAKKLNINVDNLENYDEILAQSIVKAPLIGGYFFNFEMNSTKAPSIPAIFLEKGLSKARYIPEPKGIVLNIDILQNAFYSSGFFNNTPDEGGIIRSVPLIMRYHDMLYPSLALEMIRIYLQSSKVYINNSEYGVHSLLIDTLSIPTDRFARMQVNFKGAGKSFTYISAADILNRDFNRSEIESKFILIGTSAIGLSDLRATPFDDVMAGVELHANVINTILEQNFLTKKLDNESNDIMILIVSIILSALLFSLISEWLIMPIISVLLFSMYKLNMYIFFELGLNINILFPLLGVLMSLFVVVLINYIFTNSQKKVLQKAFAKKVSPQVMNDIISHSQEGLLTPVEKEVSIFFSDIRSFTTISEKIGNPSRLIEMLNHYMTPMVDIIIKHNGTIDKFIGDAVMAYWNAPVDVKNHQDKAVISALEQLSALSKLNKFIQKKYDITIDIGIGIHSGNATVGEMGSDGRSDYTIIGDNVNLASRLEGLCKPYGVKLIISEFTKKGLKESYVIRDLDFVKVKGKTKPVKIFEVLAKGKVPKELEEELRQYTKALELYREAHFSKAKHAFEALHVEYSNFLYSMYASRCQTLDDEHISDFDGVFTFSTK